MRKIRDYTQNKKNLCSSHVDQRQSYYYGCSKTPLIGVTIGELLQQVCAAYPSNEALVYVPFNLRYTYKEFYDVCCHVARALIGLGVCRGDRVAIWATNCPEWVIIQFATALIGAVLVTINPAYRTRELEYGLRNSEAQTLFFISQFKSSNYIDMLSEVIGGFKGFENVDSTLESLTHLKNLILIGDAKKGSFLTWNEFLACGDNVSQEQFGKKSEECTFDDVINIQYTSGTTGLPRGASLTHHNILNNGYFVGEAMRLTAADRLCIPVPFYHCFGMVLGNLACVTHGATMVLPGEYFDPLQVLQAIQKEHCTALHGVPTMFIAELSHPEFSEFDLSSLRTGIMAGSPCPVELMKKVNDLMNMREVTITYGQTEASPAITMTRHNDELERRTSTVGPALPHTEVKIVDPVSGRIVPVGTQGELCCRGFQVMRGYYNNPTTTKEAIDEAGWLHTGDLALMRDDGYFKITGRIKDMVIRGGENIYPREIEEFLYSHPKIRDAYVVGVPDKKYGEELCAWIQLGDGENTTAEEIRKFCKASIAHYKVPRYVLFVQEFPMTISGKVQKYKMREISIRELNLEDGA